MASAAALQSVTILTLVTIALCRQKCYSCAFNNHATEKRGIECVHSPQNASVEWAVRCPDPYDCYYTTTVDIGAMQLLSINRGCGNIGPTSCNIVGLREMCIYSCSTDLCNGGLSGVLVETGDPNSARQHVSYFSHLTSSAIALLIGLLIMNPYHGQL
ncbi:uncharacterized protein LOC135461809 [Liolophura sinensis]|uniref:uncharacterized protein LOC135461809 n=1 Tax=Liolophura sinensis TaxID=3198878 RepID=UPI0031588B74